MSVFLGVLKIFSGVLILAIGVFVMTQLDSGDPDAEYVKETIVLGEVVSSVSVDGAEVVAERERGNLVMALCLAIFGLGIVIWGVKDVKG